MPLHWHGGGSRSVEKTLMFDHAVVHSSCADIVSLQLSANDLVTLSPLRGGSAIEDFVHVLYKSYGVKLVCVFQTIRRDLAETC